MGLSDRWDQTPPKVHSSGGVTGIPGGPQTVAYLGYLPPQIMELALQCALLTESSAQGSFLGIEKSLQVLEPGLRSQQVPLLLGIARKEKTRFQELSAPGMGLLCSSRSCQKGASSH